MTSRQTRAARETAAVRRMEVLGEATERLTWLLTAIHGTYEAPGAERVRVGQVATSLYQIVDSVAVFEGTELSAQRGALEEVLRALEASNAISALEALSANPLAGRVRGLAFQVLKWLGQGVSLVACRAGVQVMVAEVSSPRCRPPLPEETETAEDEDSDALELHELFRLRRETIDRAMPQLARDLSVYHWEISLRAQPHEMCVVGISAAGLYQLIDPLSMVSSKPLSSYRRPLFYVLEAVSAPDPDQALRVLSLEGEGLQPPLADEILRQRSCNVPQHLCVLGVRMMIAELGWPMCRVSEEGERLASGVDDAAVH